MALTKKSYGLLLAQFLCVCIFLLVGATNEGYRKALRRTGYIILQIVCAFAFGAIGIILFASRELSKEVPVNYVLFGFVTLFMSYAT